jgi:hypothetical protein
MDELPTKGTYVPPAAGVHANEVVDEVSSDPGTGLIIFASVGVPSAMG